MGAATLAYTLAGAFSSFVIGGIVSKRLGSFDQPKPDDPLLDNKPATYVERGAVLPLLIGRGMAGPSVTFLGDVTTLVEADASSSGTSGKGTSGTGSASVDRTIYFQSAKHDLCIGPGFRLLRIWEDGKILWPAPDEFLNGISWGNDATPGTDRYPSNSFFVCNDEGGGSLDSHKSQFRIHWGETDQFFAADINEGMGIRTRWPFTFWIEWVQKRLGGFPNWQSLEYEIEVRPFRAGMDKAASLLDTDWDTLSAPLGIPAVAGSGWMANGEFADEALCEVPVYFVDDTMKFCGDITLDFVVGKRVVVEDVSPFADGTHVITLSSFNGVETARVWEEFSHRRGTDWETAAEVNASGSLNEGFVHNVPDGESPGPGFPRVTVQKTVGAGTEGFIRQQISSSLYDPPGGNAGEFGNGGNRITFYLNAFEQTLTDGDEILIGFTNSTTSIGRHAARFAWRAGPDRFEIASETNAGVAELVELTSGFWELSVSYFTGTGSPSDSSGTNMYVGIGFDSAVANGQVINATLRQSDNTGSPDYEIQDGGTHANVEYNDAIECTGVTTIDIDLDTDLNLVDQFIGGLACPVVPSVLGPQGSNAGHLLYQLLFDTYPHGLGLSSSTVDLSTLQTVSLALSDEPGQEGLRSSIHLKDGLDFSAAIDDILEDLGLFMTWDNTQGLYIFSLIRNTDPVIDVPKEFFTGKAPSLPRTLERGLIPKLVYAYPNAAFRFREDDIVIPDAGVASGENSQSRNRKKLTLARDFDAATQIGERRSAEDLSPPIPFLFVASHEGSLLRPGDLIAIPSGMEDYTLIENPVRILTVQPDPDSPTVNITGAVDSYSNPPSDLALKYGGGSSSGGVVLRSAITQQVQTTDFEDFQQRAFELPGFMATHIAILYLRVPAKEDQKVASIIISDDGVTYQPSSSNSIKVDGGALLGSFSENYTEEGLVTPSDTAVHAKEIEFGPVFYSPLDTPLDLPVLDDANWHAGRLVLLVNEECMLLREVQPLGGNNYQARGVIRGAFGTTIASHENADGVYILASTRFSAALDVLPAKNIEFFTKMLVQVGQKQQPPATATAIPFTPSGKALRAFDPLNLRTADLTNSFNSGDDVVTRWDYRLHSGLEKRTGAGFQGYGELVNHDAGLQGSFTVAILDITGAFLKRTISKLSSPSYTYTTVDRVADFGLETSFRIDVQFIGDSADSSGRATKIMTLI